MSPFQTLIHSLLPTPKELQSLGMYALDTATRISKWSQPLQFATLTYDDAGPQGRKFVSLVIQDTLHSLGNTLLVSTPK